MADCMVGPGIERSDSGTVAGVPTIGVALGAPTPGTAGTTLDPAELHRLFVLEGLSYREMAARLGVTRNTVASRIRRLKIARPVDTPFRRRSTAGAAKRGGGRLQAIKKFVAFDSPRSCRWIEGDPCGAETEFCGVKTVPGKPYCAKHCARAYVARPIEATSEAIHG